MKVRGEEKLKWICCLCGKRRGKANPKRVGWLRFMLLSKTVILCKEHSKEIKIKFVIA